MIVVHAYAPPSRALGWPLSSRGLGRASALLGSVAHGVFLHRADRPLVVITERAIPAAA